jgi:hypothetical protein
VICGKIDDHGKLMRSRLIALMHGCKRRGIDAGLRRAMCYLTHNLIIDYIICFNMICGKNLNDLQKNVSYFLPERPTKRAVKIQTDSLARAATLQCLHDGYDNYNYARVVFSGIIGKQVERSNYVLYWVYCRGVGKSIPKLDAEKQEFHYDIDKIFLYLYKHMFSEALELRLLQFDSKTCITPLSIRFAYIDLLENTDNLTEAITERIPKTHEAYNLFLTWAQMDKETQPCYNDILRR